jgi:hypothetical protein
MFTTVLVVLSNPACPSDVNCSVSGLSDVIVVTSSYGVASDVFLISVVVLLVFSVSSDLSVISAVSSTQRLKIHQMLLHMKKLQQLHQINQKQNS